MPRDWWLEPWEKAAILGFHAGHPLEGYRRLAFMMLDADVVAVSPSSVYRVLRDAGLMKAHRNKPSLKGKGFHQPLRPHEHWHVDVSYINVAGTFFYLCSLLDGCSRFIVHWEICESMTEAEVETIIQRARALPRRAAPDHLRQRAAVHRQGLQGVHPDLRDDSCEDIALLSPEQRQDREVAQDAQGRMHPGQGAVSLEDARRLVTEFVAHYNEVRLHGAIGYVAPADKLAGRDRAIFAERDRQLEAARERRRAAREASRPTS